MVVKGRCLLTGLPKSFTITSTEMLEAMEETAAGIVEAVHSVLEKTPPELVGDISASGVVLTGGGSLLYGMDKLISVKTGIYTLVADDPVECVVMGTGKTLENISAIQEGTLNIQRNKVL